MDSLTFIFQYYPLYVMVLLATCAVLAFIRFGIPGTATDGTKKILFVVLLAISVMGFVVRAGFMPQRNQVFFDEHANIEVAWMLQNYGVIGLCMVGSIDDCQLAMLYPNPAGYHILLSIWFRIVGASEKNAYVFSAIIGAVSILAAGYLAYLVFGSLPAAFFSALLLCFLPIHIKYSAGTCLNNVSFLFLILFLISFGMALKTKFRIDILLHAAVALFFINIRGENWLIVIAVYLIALLWEYYRLRIGEVSSHELITNLSGNFRKTDAVFALVILLAVIPVVVYISFIVSSQKTGWVISLPGLAATLIYQLPMNIRFWFSSYNTVLLSIIGFLGIILYAIKKDLRMPVLWTVFFIAMLFGYSAYECGLFCVPDNERFIMNLNLSMVLWGGYGLAQISGAGVRRRSGVLITVAVLVLTVASFGQAYGKMMREKHPWDDGMHESRRIISDYFPSLPIVTDFPSYYTLMSSDQQVFIINGHFIPGNRNEVFLHSEAFPMSSDKRSVFDPRTHKEYVSAVPGEAVMAGFFGYDSAPIIQTSLLKYYVADECMEINTEHLGFPVCHIKLRPEYVQGIQRESYDNLSAEAGIPVEKLLPVD